MIVKGLESLGMEKKYSEGRTGIRMWIGCWALTPQPNLSLPFQVVLGHEFLSTFGKDYSSLKFSVQGY